MFIERMGRALDRVAAKIVPDPFILALSLTLIVFVAGAIHRAGSEPASAVWGSLLAGWAEGFVTPGGLAFALQMCLVLVTGHALAASPPVRRFIRWIAGLPKSAAGASFLVALVACLTGVLHWGLGAIVGAVLARELGRSAAERGVRLHYRILGAAAYSGFVVWHGGLSGSAPLKVAEPNHFAAAIVGTIPVSQTLFSSLNLVLLASLCVAIPLLFLAMTPRDPDPSATPPIAPPAPPPPVAETPVDRFQRHPAPGMILGLAGILGIVIAITRGALQFDLNAVILFFLFLGFAFQGSLVGYAEAITEGATGAGGIILQFPFYFGIVGVMKAAGLIEWGTDAMLAVSAASTFPFVAFLSAGLVNIFIPSGGGQWAVQAEILLRAGKALGVAPATTVIAFSYGDQWTNSLQPFWALPVLGIMGLKARDIIGYTTMVFLLEAVIAGGILLLLA